jgi:hypothetical protein
MYPGDRLREPTETEMHLPLHSYDKPERSLFPFAQLAGAMVLRIPG